MLIFQPKIWTVFIERKKNFALFSLFGFVRQTRHTRAAFSHTAVPLSRSGL